MLIPHLLNFLLTLNFSQANATSPFRLLTTESASNPASTGVLGLQEVGFNYGSVFVDTNPIMDALLTPNLGLKYVAPSSNHVLFTAGARYVHFVGSDVLERSILQRQPTLNQFSLDFRGFLAFVGTSYKSGPATFHLNLQWAEVSTSKVVGLVAAAEIPVSENWGAITEAGYEFVNKHPRFSAGLYRSGPVFGLRIGGTYVKIRDPLASYDGLIPVVDLYWLVGT